MPIRWLVLLLLLGSCASGLPSTPAPSPDEGGRRQQELDWLVAALERRHPDVYNTTPRAEFTRRVADLRVRLPAATPQEALVGLLEVVALVGDSHTRLPELGVLEEWSLPVSFGSWGGEFWVGAVQPDRSDLYARELVSLNGHTPEECLEALGPLVPHENELTLRAGVARLVGAMVPGWRKGEVGAKLPAWFKLERFDRWMSREGRDQLAPYVLEMTGRLGHTAMPQQFMLLELAMERMGCITLPDPSRFLPHTSRLGADQGPGHRPWTFLFEPPYARLRQALGIGMP